MGNGIYSCISEERLRDILQTLQEYTNIPIQLFDNEGNLLQSFGREASFCSLMKKTESTGKLCRQAMIKAGQRAQEIGEAYIFPCLASLNHIAFPLAVRDTLLGCVIVGPFLMDKPDTTLVSDLAEQYGLTATRSLELYDELGGLEVVTPPRVQLLKKLLDHLLLPLMGGERALMLENQEKIYQQSKINETIQRYKGQNQIASSEYFYRKEKELLTKVRTGNIREVKGLLNELIGFVLFSQGGDLELVRIRAIELTTLLSRMAMDGGARADIIYKLNNKLLPALYHEQDLDNLCLQIQEVVENFMSAMFCEWDKGNLNIRNAMRYIADHYNEHLELNVVAEHVQLSPGYFSSLFRQVTGVSFREYLCQIRVEESKQLLLSTDYSLAEIAISVGFPDQSYYCKVFKRIVGLTPGKFRG